MSFKYYLLRFCTGRNYLLRGAIVADLVAVIAGVIAVVLYTPDPSMGLVVKGLAYTGLFLVPCLVAWFVFSVSFLLANQRLSRHSPYDYI